MKKRIAGCLLAVFVAAIAAGCATVVPPPAELAARCPSLEGRAVAPARIGLRSGEARVTSAQWVPATAGGQGAPTGTPAHCRLLGSIASLDAAAQPIRFQLNLPDTWNRKALQYGGGGYNGSLITGLAPLRDAAAADALPIARGYATFGTDSGHQASSFPAGEPGAFAMNDEMLENFAFASYKKVRDVAVQLMRDFYGQTPERVYYFGGSEGGREGLTMAQRFPTDYDGIASVVPVINWTGLLHAFVRNEVPQFTDWLDSAKVPLIAKATSDACDMLDGLKDGVVNDYLDCQGRVDLSALRCPGGQDVGPACLSDAELQLMRSLHAPYTFPFPLSNGLTAYPAWLYGHEDSLDGTALSLVRWVTGRAPPSAPPDASTAATQWLYGSSWIRYAIARDAGFDVRTYRPQTYQARVQETSALMDSTNPDLSAFFARGGKLIIRENAGDRAQSAAMGFAYYDAVVARLSAAAVERSMRLYVSPASTHGGNARAADGGPAVPTMVDLLDPLDRWVTQGRAPDDALVQTLNQTAPPFATLASRPMCRYPNYPHYVAGDPRQAGSYECRVGQR